MKLHVSSTEGSRLNHQQKQAISMAADLVLFDPDDFDVGPIIEEQPDGSITLEIKNAGDATKQRVIQAVGMVCWDEMQFKEMQQ